MTPDEDRFWALAEAVTANPHVTRSTMMGLPCLRWDGQFFASYDRRGDALVVKLAEARVNELIAAGQADPFAPSGRRFRRWAAISAAHQQHWPELLTEALEFADTSG
jgi:hypothetical protein